MNIDAIALLRIPGWEPAEDLDVRMLDDGSVLVFLGVPFESDLHALHDAVVDLVGAEVLSQHADMRGIFVLPDAAEPTEAQSYEAVLAEVGAVGHFLEVTSDSADEHDPAKMDENVRNLLDQVVGAMGFSGLDEMKAMLESEDPEAMTLAHVKMSGALERSMASLSEPEAKSKTRASSPGAVNDFGEMKKLTSEAEDTPRLSSGSPLEALPKKKT